jgi:hypothetical protein
VVITPGQKLNVVITAKPDNQRDHHYMTRMPTWISLQDQKANMVGILVM